MASQGSGLRWRRVVGVALVASAIFLMFAFEIASFVFFGACVLAMIGLRLAFPDALLARLIDRSNNQRQGEGEAYRERERFSTSTSTSTSSVGSTDATAYSAGANSGSGDSGSSSSSRD